MMASMANQRSATFLRPDLASPTGAPAPHVEMEVVCMRCIIVGAQYDPKPSASAVAYCTQEVALCVVSPPVAGEPHFAAIREHEGSDVDRVCCRMFAASFSCRVVHISAVVSAEVPDAGNFSSEVLPGRLLQRVLLKQRPGRCHPAGNRWTARSDHDAMGKQHGVLNNTRGVRPPIWNAHESQARCGKGREACFGFLGEPPELYMGHQSRLGSKIERCPRVPLGRQIPVGDDPDGDQDHKSEQSVHNQHLALACPCTTSDDEVLNGQPNVTGGPLVTRRTGG